MPLYFIAADDGENRDLHAVAKSPANALAIWRAYYELEESESPDRIFKLEPTRIVGPLAWHSDACQQVGGTREGGR